MTGTAIAVRHRAERQSRAPIFDPRVTIPDCHQESYIPIIDNQIGLKSISQRDIDLFNDICLACKPEHAATNYQQRLFLDKSLKALDDSRDYF